jgi:hypothetical protein
MSHREPPSIAVWMLEHLSSGERDEALAGDLLEVFQSGRSNGWYWRQVFAACGVSWFESLRERASLLVFALLWSMAAPSWNTICSNVESSIHLMRVQLLFGPFWILPAFLGWTVLHSIFLWGGLLIFSVLLRNFDGKIDPAKFKRAFLLTPIIFVPAYGALFLTVDLHWYGYFEHFQLRTSPLDQIRDLRILADLIRIPYLLALLLALWKAIPRSRRASSADSFGLDAIIAGSQLQLAQPTRLSDSLSAKRFFVLMVGAGLMNAAIAGFLICRLPESLAPTLTLLCFKAGVYVMTGVLAGIAGTYLYWKSPASPFNSSEPVPFGLFALICAGGWVWVPATVILSEQLSPVTAIIASAGAFALTSGVRRVSSAVFASTPNCPIAPRQDLACLFAPIPQLPSADPYGYVISIGLYAGGTALFAHRYHIASALLAFVAAVFAWKAAIPQDTGQDWNKERKRAALRLAAFAIAAMLVTAWALLDGVAHRNRLAAVSAASAADAADSGVGDTAGKQQSDSATLGHRGYESIILWPTLEHEPITPPVIAENNLLAPGTKEPMVIHFNGPYWYIQPPHTAPGRRAHLAKGSPLSRDIQSSNSIPLVMDAHQYLSAPIRIARCREITVEIANRDNAMGAISTGMLLTDGTSAKHPTLYLGEQPIVSSQTGHFAIKSAPIFETLRFSVPLSSRIQRFNEITVLILPDIEHRFEAPKIAIEQFELFPR